MSTRARLAPPNPYFPGGECPCQELGIYHEDLSSQVGVGTTLIFPPPPKPFSMLEPSRPRSGFEGRLCVWTLSADSAQN